MGKHYRLNRLPFYARSFKIIVDGIKIIQATKRKVKVHQNFKNLCTLKDNIKRVQRQRTEWEKISANHLSEKGFI